MTYGQTRRLNQEEIAETAESAIPRAKPVDIAGLPRPWRIAMTVMQMGIQLIFDLSGPITIGRAYQETDTPPEIDLTPFSAENLGVSRRHAFLKLEENRVVIVDNKSSNGTFLNGEKIEPDRPYVIRHGDELSLGILKLKVELLTNPFESFDT